MVLHKNILIFLLYYIVNCDATSSTPVDVDGYLIDEEDNTEFGKSHMDYKQNDTKATTQKITSPPLIKQFVPIPALRNITSEDADKLLLDPSAFNYIVTMQIVSIYGENKTEKFNETSHQLLDYLKSIKYSTSTTNTILTTARKTVRPVTELPRTSETDEDSVKDEKELTTVTQISPNTTTEVITTTKIPEVTTESDYKTVTTKTISTPLDRETTITAIPITTNYPTHSLQTSKTTKTPTVTSKTTMLTTNLENNTTTRNNKTTGGKPTFIWVPSKKSLRLIDGFFTSPMTTTLHPIVADVLYKINNSSYGQGPFTGFLIKLIEIITTKTYTVQRELTLALEKAFFVLYENGLLIKMGDAGAILKRKISLLNAYPPDMVRSQAKWLKELLENKEKFLANDTNEILNKINKWYTLEQGTNLIKTLRLVHDYPKEISSLEVVDKILLELLTPYYETSDNVKNLIFKSVNEALKRRGLHPRRRYLDNYEPRNTRKRLKRRRTTTYDSRSDRNKKYRENKRFDSRDDSAGGRHDGGGRSHKDRGGKFDDRNRYRDLHLHSHENIKRGERHVYERISIHSDRGGNLEDRSTGGNGHKISHFHYRDSDRNHGSGDEHFEAHKHENIKGREYFDHRGSIIDNRDEYGHDRGGNYKETIGNVRHEYFHGRGLHSHERGRYHGGRGERFHDREGHFKKFLEDDRKVLKINVKDSDTAEPYKIKFIVKKRDDDYGILFERRNTDTDGRNHDYYSYSDTEYERNVERKPYSSH